MSTALITATPDETIDDADFDMKLADIRHILVVDDHNRLAGVVSNRDIVQFLTTQRKNKPVRVASIMTTNVQTISGDAPASEAVHSLLNEKIGCLPVVGGDGQLRGVVTETDFLRVAHRVLLGESDARNVL